MSRESRIVFGFFDEILRGRPLIVEPRQKRDPTADIRDEYAIAVLRGVEQLILFRFFRRWRLLLFD